METREPGQVRKEAALSGHLQARRECRTGAIRRWPRPGYGFEGGCTVHFSRRAVQRRRIRHARPGRRSASGARGEAAPPSRLDTTVSTGPSLYRRHRPRTFADVVGQEHVVRTLSNAVERGKVHHAYLFVGSRGTGKTSMAKILAACLNCVNGPTIDAVRRLRLVRLDRQRHLARRDRDGRRLQQLGRRHPRPAREGRLRARLGPPQGLHPRRGAHALARRPGTRS